MKAYILMNLIEDETPTDGAKPENWERSPSLGGERFGEGAYYIFIGLFFSFSFTQQWSIPI